MPIREIYNDKETTYLTIEESIRLNGDRHLERAIAYASAQWPEHYYQGSMKKALKNYKKVDEFKIPEELEVISDWLNNAITKSIMDGFNVK